MLYFLYDGCQESEVLIEDLPRDVREEGEQSMFISRDHEKKLFSTQICMLVSLFTYVDNVSDCFVCDDL